MSGPIRIERRTRQPRVYLRRRCHGGPWDWAPEDTARNASAVVAYVGDVEVGRLVFVFDGGLVSKGTLVSTKHRKRGIARRLWSEALRWKRPWIVYVACESDAGWRLVEGLRGEFDYVQWAVFDDRAAAAS